VSDAIFIKALYFGKEHPNGFTISDLESHLQVPEANWGPLQREFEGQRPENAFNQSNSREGKPLYWLTKSGHKLLAELDDVRHAKEQAERAHNLAKISIVVAVTMPIVSIVISKLFLR